MTRFSDINAVNAAVARIAEHMGLHPYSWDVVREAPMTVNDLIERIKFEFGTRAAASIKIVLH